MFSKFAKHTFRLKFAKQFRGIQTFANQHQRSLRRSNVNLLSYRAFSVKNVIVPNMGDSISEGTLIEWSKQPGEYVYVDDIVAIIETDKVSIEIRAEEAGKVTEHFCGIEDTVEVGGNLFAVDTSVAPPASKLEPTPAPQTPAPAAPASTPTPASQAAPPTPAASKPPTPVPSPVKPVAGSRGESRVKMTRMRKTIARQLKDVQNTLALLTTFNEVDMTNLMKVRKVYQDEFVEKHGVKLGFMSPFLKAVQVAMLEQPILGAHVEDEHIVYKDYVDIGVAAATPNGLVVPVVRNVETMNLAEIEKEIKRLAGLAKNNKLALEDMRGGNFTISNGGIFKNVFGTPIPGSTQQSALLGMHGVFDRPVAVNGQVVIRPMMYVALTYDHRIIDGREAALFLRKVKACVEDPVRFALDL